jgi:hypothetical protein
VTALLVASAGDHADAVRSLLKAGAALDGNSTKDEDDAKDDNDDNDDNDDESNNDEEGGDTGRGKDGGGDWREWAETRALGGDPGRGAMDDDFWVQADLDPVAEGGWRRVPERGARKAKPRGMLAVPSPDIGTNACGAGQEGCQMSGAGQEDRGGCRGGNRKTLVVEAQQVVVRVPPGPVLGPPGATSFRSTRRIRQTK